MRMMTMSAVLLLSAVSGCTLVFTPNDTGETNQGAGLGGATDPSDAVGVQQDVLEPAVELVAGDAHVCALSASGTVSCWGRNSDGQLGYGHTEAIGDDEYAGADGVVDVGGTVVSLSAGARHTCAIVDDGSVACWGFGGDLALGHGNSHPETIGDDETPSEAGSSIIYGVDAFVQLAAGGRHTCVLYQAGLIKCWGTSDVGALGYGYNQTSTGGWLGMVPTGDSASVVVAGSDHTCAIVGNGAVRCWGKAESIGTGGTENIGDDEFPSGLAPLPIGGVAIGLAAGAQHTCALGIQGDVRCWGNGSDGRLGYGTTADHFNAMEVGPIHLGGMAVQIAAGTNHTCALLLEGNVRCWGAGSDGALGYGNGRSVGDDEAPAIAGDVELSEPAVQVVAGDGFTCALLASGAVSCWGRSDDGQLGRAGVRPIGIDVTPASILPVLPFGH